MKKVIKTINFFLLIIAILLSFLIFKNKDFNLGKLNQLFNTMTNFLNIGKTNQKVSSSVNFIKLEKDKYYNDSFTVFSPFKGTIIDKQKTSITIKCDNGYLAFFDNLVSVSISKYDVIETFNKLGYFEDYFIFYFIKGEEKYSYEEIMEINWSYKC